MGKKKELKKKFQQYKQWDNKNLHGEKKIPKYQNTQQFFFF